MKTVVLMVHNRYLLRGGEDASFEAEVELLREHGHEVILYEESNERIADMSRLRAFCRTTWSAESYRKVSALIVKHHPDIMHVQNFFPLISPSIHHAASRRKIPVVQSLRNYRLMCPNALFLRNGMVCEDCLGKTFPWPGIRYACYRDCRPATAAVACMIAAHRFAGTWRRHVARFVALTEFSRQKFVEGGFSEDSVVVRKNFIPDPGPSENEERNGGLFVGMLHPWKGAHVLLEAWQKRPEAPDLTIVGDGPEKGTLRAFADPRVRFPGILRSRELNAKLKKALFLVFPSVWYETFGRTIIEAFACGTPVIASRLGAAADLVSDHETGLHFTPGDPDDLAEKIHWAVANPDAMRRMGQRARREYERKYTPDVAYGSLMAIYRDAMGIQA